MRNLVVACALLAFAGLASEASEARAKRPKRGIVGKSAPALRVHKWINVPAGKKTVRLSDYRGKVVYLYFFQAGCPGCLKHGFPALRTLTRRYKKDDKVAFIAIQTPFEGFKYHTARRLPELAKRFKLSIPMGHDGRHSRKRLMRRYRTGGTPWVAIIDHTGVVRFDGYHLRVHHATRLLNALKSAM